MMAKAVAHHTTVKLIIKAAFIRVVGSEFV